MGVLWKALPAIILSKGAKAATSWFSITNAATSNVNKTGLLDAGVAEVSHINSPMYEMVILFGALALCAFIRQWIGGISIPYPFFLLLVGVMYGAIAETDERLDRHLSLYPQNPYSIIHVVMPVLVMESTFAMDFQIFRTVIVEILLLAVPGMVAASCLTAILAYFSFGYSWSWFECLMFGSIVNATDSSAISDLLRNIGNSKRFSTILETESLFNNGCALMLFNIFYNLSYVGLEDVELALFLPRQAIGGYALGVVMGKVCIFWLKRVLNNALVEVSIIVTFTYLTFSIGEFILQVSGIIAVVMLGIEINTQKACISPEVETFLYRLWEVLAYLANTFIFVYAGRGVVLAVKESFNLQDLFLVFLNYVFICLIRCLVVVSLSPFFKRFGCTQSWRSGVIVIWGGLRGVLALILSLQIFYRNHPSGGKMFIHASFLVILSLICNGATIKPLLHFLDFGEWSRSKRVAINNAIKLLNENVERSFVMLKTDRFLAQADWDEVKKAVSRSPAFLGERVEEEGGIGMRFTRCVKCAEVPPDLPTAREFSQTSEDGRIAMIRAEKTSFWKQFERGMLSRKALQVLSGVADQCMDEKDRFPEANDIRYYWTVPPYWQTLRSKLSVVSEINKTNRIPPPRNLFLRYNYLIATHPAFDATLNILIIINMVPIIMEIRYPYARFSLYLRPINYFYYALYALELFIKVSAFRFHYFRNYWNLLDLIIVIISTIDVALEVTTGGAIGSIATGLLKEARIFRILRVSRLLKLVKSIVPRLLDKITNHIHQQLSFGCDVCTGYIVAKEEVSRILDHLVTSPKICQDLRIKSEKHRQDVMKSLGQLQREYPGIAISLKTRQAIRSVVNNAKATLGDLRTNGVLEKLEAAKLEETLESILKGQLKTPSFITPKKPERFLRSLVWLKGIEDEAVEYITTHAEMISYEAGDVMIKQGQPCDGIYLIVSGMVRVMGVSQMAETTIKTTDPGYSELNVSMDYLFAGSVIGEMGVLTDTVRNATIVCETTVHAYFISVEHMRVAVREFRGLFEGLWQVSAVRIAVPLLLASARYKGWTKDRIRLMCENSSMAHFESNEGVLDTTDKMREAVLVRGELLCMESRTRYKAPVILPKQIQRYRFHNGYDLQVLIIWDSLVISRGREESSSWNLGPAPVVSRRQSNAKGDSFGSLSYISKKKKVKSSDD